MVECFGGESYDMEGRNLIRVVYLCTAFIIPHHPPQPQLETCLSLLHNPAGLLSPSLMYGGWWCNKMVANAGGWQGIPEPSCNFNEFYVNYVFLQFFPGMLGKEWGAGSGERGGLRVPSRLGSGVLLC